MATHPQVDLELERGLPTWKCD